MEIYSFGPHNHSSVTEVSSDRVRSSLQIDYLPWLPINNRSSARPTSG
jgi:hypothetical protein